MIDFRRTRIMLIMQKHILTLFAAVALVTAVHPFEHLVPVALAQDTASRAAAVLAEARKALGGEDKLRSIKALQAAGGYRRSMGEMQIEGDLEILLEPPDKLRRNEEIVLPMGTMVRTEVLNGDEVWEDSSQHGGMAHGGAMMIRMGPGGAAMNPERVKDMQRHMRRMELARFSLAWLLSTDAPAAHAGIAEAPDGKADMIDVKPTDGPAMRLFIDQQSHLPLMIAWKAPAPRMIVRRGSPGAPAPNPEQAAREADAQGPPPEANFEMRLSGYRKVDGIQFPHEISRAMNGTVNEEWTVRSYKVNPSFKANTFTK
jgi:hypothetical protein